MAGEYVADAAYDAALDYIANNAVRVAICTSSITSYASIAAARLAEFTVDSSDYTKAAGDTSGRKLTLSAQTGATASASGTGTHAVHHNNSNAVLAVTPITSQAITSGNTVNLGSYDVTEIRDAAAA